MTARYELEIVSRMKMSLSIEPADRPVARQGPRLRERDRRTRSGTIR